MLRDLSLRLECRHQSAIWTQLPRGEDLRILFLYLCQIAEDFSQVFAQDCDRQIKVAGFDSVHHSLMLIVGLAMDVVPTILILTPIVIPVLNKAGVDLVYFGIVFVLANVLGLTAPPVGPVLNVACATGNVKMGAILKPVLPYFVAQKRLGHHELHIDDKESIGRRRESHLLQLHASLRLGSHRSALSVAGRLADHGLHGCLGPGHSVIAKDTDDLRRIESFYDSPYNGFTLCTGSLGENPTNDVPALIREFGGRDKIGFAQIRNIKFTSDVDFHETAHPSSYGSLDMYEIMRAFYDAGFDGYARPDHGRDIWGEQGRPGYGLHDRALGIAYLSGLWEAITKANRS